MIRTCKYNQFVLEPRFTKDGGICDGRFNQTKVQVTAVESICDTGRVVTGNSYFDTGVLFLKIDHRVHDDVVSNGKARANFNDTTDGIACELLIELCRLIKQ